MQWYQYSCCGRTFTRRVSFDQEPMPCPACFRLANPFVSCHILPLAQINRAAPLASEAGLVADGLPEGEGFPPALR